MEWRDWRSAIENGDAVFLVGAGISVDPPAQLPIASQLSRALAVDLSDQIDLPTRLKTRVVAAMARLRPEVLGDILVEHLGSRALSQVPILLSHGDPNRWHSFLARAIGNGCSVVTTNFDTLIEEACERIGVTPIVIASPHEVREAKRLTSGILLKVHGSLDRGARIGETAQLALAIRQVGRGIPQRIEGLLRLLLKEKPLFVVGYAGRDDFDIAPWMRALPRTAPGTWIVHDHKRPRLLPLSNSERRWAPARPAIDCQKSWGVDFAVFRGPSRLALNALTSGLEEGRAQPANPKRPARRPAPASARSRSGTRATQALSYALLQSRRPSLAIEVIALALRTHSMSPWARGRLLLDLAVMRQSEGVDLRGAESAADDAIKAAQMAGSRLLLAAALDQRGVVARRRGKYEEADGFYKRALQLAKGHRPKWFEVQVRAHRAVALGYLKRYDAALREHRRVLAFERSVSDLRGVAMTLNNIAIILEWKGRYREAIHLLNDSIVLKRQFGDHRGIAQSLHNLGHLRHRTKDYQAAAQDFERSLSIRLKVDPHGAAQALIGLGRTYLRLGRRREAKVHASDALRRMSAYGDARGIKQARDLLRECRVTARQR